MLSWVMACYDVLHLHKPALIDLTEQVSSYWPVEVPDIMTHGLAGLHALAEQPTCSWLADSHLSNSTSTASAAHVAMVMHLIA